MIECEKCGSIKEHYMRYYRSKDRQGFGAGTACPKCEPHLVWIQPEPWWLYPESEILGGERVRC